MGKAIVYCQTCGKSLYEDDFDRGRASRQDNRPYCAECRPPAPAPPPAPPPSTRRVTSQRLPVLRPPAGDRPPSTARLSKPSPVARRSSALLWGSILFLVVAGGIAATLVILGRSSPEKTPPPEVRPPPVPPSPPRPSAPGPTPLERDLEALHRLLAGPPDAWKTGDIEALFRRTESGARKEEIEKLRRGFERGLRLLDLREGLIGRWTLDEAGGSVARDASGRGNDGTIVGSPGRVPGRIGGAFQFRGGDDYVEIPSLGELDIREIKCFTLAAWFMPDSLPPGKEENANDAAYAVFVRPGNHFGLNLDREGRMRMGHWLENRKNLTLHAKERITPRVWTHVAGLVDTRLGRSQIFLNGKAAGELSWPARGRAHEVSSPWRIGLALPKARDWGWPARGLVDEILFYGRVLSPEEIALLAQGAVPPDADPRKREPADDALVLHLKADAELKLEGIAVSAWSDPARKIEGTSAVPDERPALKPVEGQAAIRFDGKNDRLAIAHRPELAFAESESYTLAIRVHLETPPAKGRWQGVATKSLETPPWYGIWIDDQARWTFGTAQNLHGAPARTGTSVVVAVQEGGRERRLYVDGRRVATGPPAASTGTGPFWIGGGNSRPEFFEGSIRDVRLWRRALDPAEIRGMMR